MLVHDGVGGRDAWVPEGSIARDCDRLLSGETSLEVCDLTIGKNCRRQGIEPGEGCVLLNREVPVGIADIQPGRRTASTVRSCIGNLLAPAPKLFLGI
jgi:hypothetical protein